MENSVNIRIATIKDIDSVCDLACLLFGCNKDDILNEYNELLKSSNVVFYIAEDKNKVVAFAQFGLRFDYVEGTTSSPVGYIEGVYVQKEYRNMKIAAKMVKLGEQWAKQKGCLQMASDCELTNVGSYNFHNKIGYSEANKIVCFKKDI